jgi:hypothetical protein
MDAFEMEALFFPIVSEGKNPMAGSVCPLKSVRKTHPPLKSARAGFAMPGSL